ncbi:Methyltransferase family protein [Candidatus Methanoperedens nitroreducens]|uniref:Methyltransferase family protein n=1 Tax=Candidatus Methanoperedens nitratireducens TaxID=1392998 RepID=A0A284VUK2_9EURY|nr:Methyltransferase family protein [Candidatus Methanoperedens nitroreducens]
MRRLLSGIQEEINIKKLHLGCGKRYIPGFTHVDLADYPHIDYRHNVSDLSMFEDDSIELIYACHVLEHFKRHEVENVLKEWHRVLVPNGILRLAVPDFEAVAQVYEKYKDMELVMGLLYGGQEYEYNFHHVLFDFKYLEKLLEKVGFKNIHRYDWRNTVHRDYDDYSQAYIPHMDKEHGVLMSLNVEGEKG